mgnify:CR=1 FL=1
MAMWRHVISKKIAKTTPTHNALRCVLDYKEVEEFAAMRRDFDILQKQVSALTVHVNECHEALPALSVHPTDNVIDRIFYCPRHDAAPECVPDVFLYIGRAAPGGGLLPPPAYQTGRLVFKHISGEGFGPEADRNTVRGGVCDMLGMDHVSTSHRSRSGTVDKYCLCVPPRLCSSDKFIKLNRVQIEALDLLERIAKEETLTMPPFGPVPTFPTSASVVE